MLILLLLLLLTAPVQLTLQWDRGFSIAFSLWGIRTVQHPQGASESSRLPHQQRMRLLGTLLRTNHARRFLLRHTQLISFQALLRPGLQDAASTALLTGFLRQLSSLLPSKADVRIQPNFTGTTQLQARCILFFHLGTILVTAVMVLCAYVAESREHPLPHSKEA